MFSFLIPPRAITFFLVIFDNVLNLCTSKNSLLFLTLKIGEINIKSTFCFFLISISLKLWAEPIIFNLLSIFPRIEKFLLNEGKYIPSKLNLLAKYTLLEINKLRLVDKQNFLTSKTSFSL